MNGAIPEIYWYVFWVGFVILGNIGMYFGFTMTHRQRMKALEILRMYAEKGAEPPPAITEHLAKQIFETDKPSTAKREGRAALIQGFIGFTFTACVSYGLTMWLTDAKAPNWAIYAATGAWAFFSFGAFGMLLAALVSRKD